MPLVIGDYRKDTGRLTTEQHGAYLLLIMDYWISGPPADDDEDLMSITGLDARAWKKTREKLARFFTIEGGVWRHKRIDEELARWSQKKIAYAARAQAGGKAKAAKSLLRADTKNAHSTEKQAKTSAPQPASTEVEDPSGHSTLSDGDADVRSSVPADVRAAFLKHKGHGWTGSYIDKATWAEEGRVIVPRTHQARVAIRDDARAALAELTEAGLAVTIQEAPPPPGQTH